LFYSFKIIMKSLNGLLFFVIVILIDLFLLHYFNKQMSAKLTHTTDKAKQAELEAKKKSTNQMIIINGCITALAHLPEFVITILLVCFRQFLTRFCTEYLSCDLINEEAQFFCLISMTFQFFIFMKYNKSLRESFLDLLSCGKKWKIILINFGLFLLRWNGTMKFVKFSQNKFPQFLCHLKIELLFLL